MLFPYRYFPLRLFFAITLAALLLGSSAYAQAQPRHIQKNDILQYLDQLIAWHRSLTGFNATPGNAQEILLKDTLTQSAAKVLTSGFDFARAEAEALNDSEKSHDLPDSAIAGTDQQRALAKAASTSQQQAQDVQAKLQDINQQLKSATARTRPLLQATRDKLLSEQALVKQQQTLLRTVVKSLNGNDADDVGNLEDKIDDMARSVPELQSELNQQLSNAAHTAIPAGGNTGAPAAAAPGNGIFGLASEMFSLSGKKSDLDQLVERTAGVRQANAALRASLRATLRDAGARATAIAKADAADVQALATQRQQLDAITATFKQLSAAIMPLVEQGVWMDAAQHTLQDWRISLNERMGNLLRALILRLGMLAVAVAVPLVVSEALRRATVRYIRDPRRQQLLKRVRKVAVSVVVVLIVLLSFATEFGSLATFAGFITAGLAVALQNVILSAVAYFFFFGRFGVRTGDRVSVNGVTGDVIQIGIVRLYLMELGGTNLELYPTGRIVAFPNSILFQNSAFFKQIPGTNYTWHEITMPLAAETNYEAANKELLAAVEKIYVAYRPDMDRQQTALMESTHLNVEAPRPKGWLRFTDTGLAFIIRYPVEIGSAAEVDDRITKQLLQTIAQRPELKLSGVPKIQTVAA